MVKLVAEHSADIMLGGSSQRIKVAYVISVITLSRLTMQRRLLVANSHAFRYIEKRACSDLPTWHLFSIIYYWYDLRQQNCDNW